MWIVWVGGCQEQRLALDTLVTIIKAVSAKLFNTGTVIWTETEFGFVHVEKGEEHEEHSAVCRCSSARLRAEKSTAAVCSAET